jgi:ketosteroid isomerase-like protein
MSLSRKLAVTAVVTVGFFAAALTTGHGAGSNAADDAAIRKLIAANDQKAGTIQQLPDHIFWTAAYKRPTVGDEKGDPMPGPQAISERVPGSQKTTTEPIRIVIADSHDLAYEYSKRKLEYDLKSGEHVQGDTGVLRVWQKQGGEWKEAASFARPYEQ